MPSPPQPEAVAPTSASFVKSYAKRGTGQPPFASLLDRLTDHPSFQDRPALPAVPHARSDDPSRRFDAASVHAPANRDSASAADSRPANESSAGSHGGADQPNAAPHATASGQSADRSAKDTPAHEGGPVSSTADAASRTGTAAAPSTQGPAAAAPIDTTGTQAVAAVLSLAVGGDAAAGAAGAGKGDNLAISGAKAPPSPSDLAPRPTIAAGAAGAAATAGQTASAGAADQDADPPGDTPTGAGALPRASAPAPGQLAGPPAVETDPTDATAKSGRLAPDVGDADRPHATAATSNPTGDAALGTPSASDGTSAAAPADNRATAVPLSEIAVTIAAQARSGKSRFDIRLDPPELGRIDVQLNVDRSGNVSSRLIVERPETLDLIRRDALQLERALQDAGLNTGNGMQFSLADQGFANRNGLIDHAVRAPLAAAVDEPVAPAAAYAAAAGHRGGLDITV
jgi:flagellar hook-length control protein FliK